MAVRTLIRMSALTVVAAVTATALVACSSSSSAAPASTPSSSAAGIPQPKYDKAAYSMLPASVKSAKVLKLATVPLPPYAYKAADGTTELGLNVDMVAALKKVFGINVTLDVAPTISDVYTGMTSGKYDANISPLSDIPAVEANYDFADWLAEYVVFIQEKTATAKITSLTSACGHTIATLQGGTAQTVLTTANKSCSKPITIALFQDQDSAILAVKSGRADAAFSSQIPLTYYVKNDSTLTLSGANSTKNGFPPFWVGASAPKGSPLVPAILAAMNDLKKSGTYTAILKKYGIQDNAISTFGINFGTKKS
jgi:polar amino acid transport system substrate-binding protein